MFRLLNCIFILLAASGSLINCASNDRNADGSQSYPNRQPAGYSRAGRVYREPRAMNHRRSDTDALFSACMREQTELYCRNRMGR